MSVVEILSGDAPVIRVMLSAVSGSAPRDAGAEMFVSQRESAGTIGGGRLEYIALDAARKILTSGEAQAALDIPLGPEIGQCCGGRVSLSLSLMSDADRNSALLTIQQERRDQPHIFIMGSGHIGRALADHLQHLPFNTVLVDQREDELARCDAVIVKRLNALPESEITAAPPSSAFVVLTHDHALDFMLTAAALDRGDAAYVGLIGSSTKRAKFESWLRQQEFATPLGDLVCPIGAKASRDKRPEVIAALVAAEITEALCLSDRTAQRARDCVPSVLSGIAG